MGSPFLHGFAFIVLDGDTDLPQYLLIDLADRVPSAPIAAGVLKSKIAMKSSWLKYCSGFQSTAGHQGIGDADGCGSLKLHLDVKFIIIL